MKNFIFITLLCTITASPMMFSMKRLLEESPANKSLESWCATKLYEYHSPDKQLKPFERSNSDLNLWGSPRKDVTHTEDYDMNCVSSIIAENTELEENYGKILPRSSFSIAYEKIINTEDTELEKDFFQTSSEYTKKAIAVSLPTQIHTNIENTKSTTNTKTKSEEDFYQLYSAYFKEIVEPTAPKKPTKICTTKFFCTVDGCGKAFTAQNYLDTHITWHNELSLQFHRCTFNGCDKSFTSKIGLTNHMGVHSDKKSHTCTFYGCGKSFIDQQLLTCHTYTHTGERPYACPFNGCNKTFIQSAHVQSHILTHTNQRPYICTIEGCKKSFTQNSHLQGHINTHTGEKPYLCTVEGCDKSFTTKSNRNKHSKTCTKKKTDPYTVREYNESFAS